MISSSTTKWVAVYDNGAGELRAAVIIWQEHDFEVYGLVEQEGYHILKPAHKLPGFLRYEPCD